ncbi:MAG: polysaccharide deacetylase family protein [Bacillota bacterium]
MKLMKLVLTVLVILGSAVAGIGAWLLGRSRVVVLCYHTISSDFPAEMTPERFARHIELLLAAGYKFISIEQYAAWVNNQLKLPAKSALMTFDDGFANHIANAIPILQKYNIPAINFIVAEKIGGQYAWDGVPPELHEPLMDEQQVREWLTAGYSIGSHTLTHDHLDSISTLEKARQIVTSKAVLEAKFQQPITWLCYPFGDFDRECESLAKHAGYFGAFACYRNTNPWKFDRFAIRRVLVYPSWSDKKFLYKISRAFDLVAMLNLSLKKIKARAV